MNGTTLPLLAAVLLVGAPAPSRAQATASAAPPAAATDKGRWHYAITAYLWASSMKGEASFKGLPPQPVDVSWGDIWGNLDFGALAGFEAHNGRWGASSFGKDAFRILDWALREPNLVPVVARVSRRARASAHRVDARYLLDGDQPLAALKAWMSALLIHPPTAFARLNILASALLNILGLKKLRRAILHHRQQS